MRQGLGAGLAKQAGYCNKLLCIFKPPPCQTGNNLQSLKNKILLYRAVDTLTTPVFLESIESNAACFQTRSCRNFDKPDRPLHKVKVRDKDIRINRDGDPQYIQGSQHPVLAIRGPGRSRCVSTLGAKVPASPTSCVTNSLINVLSFTQK